MTKIFGLVACGGSSSRMGTEKFLLKYHDIPQWNYIYNLLEQCCDKVFVSCSEMQSAVFPTNIEKIIDDKVYSGIGPISGLLTAFDKHPTAAFLFVGCDYPFVESADLKLLIDNQKENEVATAFYNSENIYEPLIALYKSRSYELLKKNYLSEKFSLRFFLEEVNAVRIKPRSLQSILSVDTMEDYDIAKKFLE